MRRLLLPLIAIAAIAGCTNATQRFGPPPPFDRSVDLKMLQDQAAETASIDKYYAGGETREKRDKFITARLLLINYQYIDFIRSQSASKAQLDTAFDMLQLGVGIATTLAGGATTKAILGGATTGITGTRTTIDKNFFFEKTVPALITSMNAARKQALVPILKGMSRELADYPFAQALSDLDDYYFAGTFPGALQTIQKDAGVKEARAEKAITFERDKLFLEKERQGRVKDLVDAVGNLSASAAINLVKTMPVKNEELEKVIDARDKSKKRFKDGAVAKDMLKMAIVMSERDDASLKAWEAAVAANN